MLFVCKYMGNYEAEAGKTFVRVLHVEDKRKRGKLLGKGEKKSWLFSNIKLLEMKLRLSPRSIRNTCTRTTLSINY